MKIISKHLLLTFLIVVISKSIYSQPTQNNIIKLNFISMLDSLIAPPTDCQSAFELMEFDSVDNKFVHVPRLEEQDQMIQKLYTELNSRLNNSKKDRSQMPHRPEGKGPPGGTGPPGGNDEMMSEEMHKLAEDLKDVNDAVDKIIIERGKFKNELIEMQTEVNEKLHKTLEADHNSRINIINSFLKSGSSGYQKFKESIKFNMLKIDDLMKKHDHGSKIRLPVLQSEILKLQLEQVISLKLFLNVTKELVNIGAKYYGES